MDYPDSVDDLQTGFKTYEFVFMFNQVTGSPRILYFMIDPWSGTRLFPKANPIVLDDCLYIIGGKNWETGEYIASTWRYDPATSKWAARANIANARCRHTADVVNGCIYITGGEVQGGSVTDSCECYDPFTDKWTSVASLPRQES
ncbi:hypothetical protein KUTeg_014031 [Tegillarca granosa]|uniref:Uncharacterized protein n=1 Tax=Tegillarca granosa TaxID=220873 RepID=A0ABQ9EVE8_TEGGR|nr:hypothetical protein KUTeg_014031 [Tegillarca granosa]